MIAEIATQVDSPLKPYLPFPNIADRNTWENLPVPLLSRLIADGETALATPYSVITATDFMDFCRTGNRTDYEQTFFSRRIRLNTLVLAECAEYKGRFLDAIIDGIFLICSEAAWQLPAHNAYIRDTPQHLLPDFTRPVIDLFAAETGAVLSAAVSLLAPVLDGISPVIHSNVMHCLTNRLVTPYLGEYFWWMGDGQIPLNNWTAWCTQNILLTVFCLPFPDAIKTAVFQKAAKSLDYFLAQYGEDGCCDEGAQYYRHAALCLFHSLEILNEITNHYFLPLYQNKKLQNMAAYILNVHVDDQYYINFSDCAAIAGRCSAREYLAGKRIGNPDLAAFAAADYQRSEDPLLANEQNPFYRLLTIFTQQELYQQDPVPAICHPDIFYPSAGVFIARDSRFCLAVKAGDNDDSHNHNDTGSFTIYKNGRPLFIDIGVESYNQKTFSPRRYEIWTMQSAYHNLLSFGGIMQKNGAEYQANKVAYSFSKAAATIEMELAAAYDHPGLDSYLRSISLFKEDHILVRDCYCGTLKPAVLTLMTCEKPKVNLNTISVGNLGTCKITGSGQIRVETIPITDPRLLKTWNDRLYRCLIPLTNKELTLLIK